MYHVDKKREQDSILFHSFTYSYVFLASVYSWIKRDYTRASNNCTHINV